MREKLSNTAFLTILILVLPACSTLIQPEAHEIGSTFKDCVDCPEMVVLPAGDYLMGSPDSETDRREHEGPQRRVNLPGKFAVSKFEITHGQFAAFIAATNYVPANNCIVWTGVRGGEQVPGRNWQDPNFEQSNNNPVVCISWTDAKAFVAWLVEKTAKSYRLLTESEWEYAARAGTTSRYSFGDNADSICGYANVPDQTAERNAGGWYWKFVACDDGYGAQTSPVGTYQPNPFGLYDMHGNVWEWVEDCYQDSFSGGPVDGSAWITDPCKGRVVRGGSLSAPIDNSRSAARYIGIGETRNKDKGDPEQYANFNLGMRVALTLE